MARNPRRSDPTGSYRKRVEESDAYENIAGMLPGIGTAMTITDIEDELKKEEPNYLKIGMLAGTEAIGLIPGLGTAAKSMIRKGADMARQTDEAINVASNVPKVTKTKPEEFSGIIPTRHGFTGDRPTEFLPRGEYKGQRYDSTGGVFGDKPLYLEDPENPFFLTDDGVVSFSYDDVTDVDASFDKAFVLTPETVGTLKNKVGDVDLLDEASGPLVVDKLEELGYDGLIIRGFPDSNTTELGRLRAEQSDKLRSLSKEDFNKGYGIVEDYKPKIQAAREAEGIDETLQQSQILAFRPERQKVLDPAGNPQLDNEAYAAKMNAFDVEDDMVKWKENVKEEISKSRDVDPVVRTYPLEDAAQKFLDKEITREEYLKYIDEYKPVTGWDQLPREPSTKAMVYSLKPNQISRGSFVVSPEDAAKLDVKQSSLSIGDFFDGRLDVTAYKEFDTWIVAGAKTGEKGQHYAKAVHYQGGDGKPVILLNSDNPKKYETNIKTGERIGAAQKNPKGQTYGKTPYAAISGYVKDLDVENIRKVAAQLLNDPEWVQLGFDPRRQGNFYVRREKSNAPLHAVATSAEEVIQIGPLVLAKNPVLDLDYAGYAEGGVAMDEQMDAVFKSSRTDIDPVSGNEVPPGSLPEEVRDDIPAMLSEGEYVVPADVLRFYGVKFFEDLRAQAKMGLAEMEANGRIGGEPIEEETGDVGISDQELMVIMAQAPQEEQQVMANQGGLMGFQAGGLNYPAYIKQPDLTQFGMAGPDFQGGLEYRTYVNDAGMEITIPFFNGDPMGMIPPGYSLKGEVAQQEEAPQVSQDDDEPVRVQRPAPEEFDLDAIPTEKLEETARGMSTMTNIASGIASMAGLPVAALVNTTGVARYNDVLDRLKAEDPEAFEKSGLEKKGSIFGGESSLYENLADSDGDGKKSFGDTWLGDFLGFDGKAGIAEGNPGLRDSIGGARRTGDDNNNSQPSSFGEAFAAARAEQGSGGTFEYDGNTYSTNTAEEDEE
jgi:hypothetical protein